MLRGVRAVVLLAAVGSCLLASAGEPITLTGHRSGVNCVSFSPDGGVLATGSGDKTMRLWPLPATTGPKEGQRRWQLLVDLDDDSYRVRERASSELAKLGWEVGPLLLKTLEGTDSPEVRARIRRLLAALRASTGEQHGAEVRCVAFSPDGALVASGSKDRRIRLFSARTGEEVATIDGQSGMIWSVAFSPDGLTLASGGMDHSVKLWDVAPRRLRATLVGHRGPVHSVAFSPDGRTLASAGSFDGTVRLWNVAGGELQAVFKGHENAVLCAAFSPDSKGLASAGYGGEIKLWNVATDQPTLVSSFQGHSRTIRSVTFSPDGKTLASASEDNSAKLWEVGSGKLVTTLKDHRGAVNSVAFSPDGRTVATAGLDGTVKLWSISERQE